MTRKEQIIQAAMQEEKKVGFAQIVKDARLLGLMQERYKV